MKVKVDVLSDKKGSNPGGFCTIRDSKGSRILDGYFKYCFGESLPRGIPFKAEHQPVLEVLASLKAREFGLVTPDCFVLINDGKVSFSNLHDEKDHSGKKYYFVSKLEPNPSSAAIDRELNTIVESEKIYLDSLLLRDYGTRNNILYKEGRASYIDLGCWGFACANEGLLKQIIGKKELVSDKDRKKLIRRLEKDNLRNANGEIINLGEFARNIPESFIPLLNPNGGYAIAKSLLTNDELNAVQGYLAQNLDSKREAFRKADLLV